MLPDSPVFFTQLAYQRRGLLHAVADSRVKSGAAFTGLLLDAGAVPLNGVKAAHASRGSADPVLIESSEFGREKKHNNAMAPWVQEKAPTKRSEWDAAIQEAVKLQRKLGVSAISVPAAELASGGYPIELERQVDAIRRAFNKRPPADLPWLARVCIHDDWLVHAGMSRLALNLLTDLPDDVNISLHVRFTKRDRISDAAVLRPLRSFVEALADDGRKVLMAQSGLLGWLAMAWGAWGLSAGLSQSSWVDSGRETIRRRAGQPSPPRVERFFEPALLHHVIYDDHRTLMSQPGYFGCSCDFCNKLGTTWAADPAEQHGLFALGEFVENLRGTDRSGRRARIRKTIEDAQTRWAGWSQTVSVNARSQPKHLSTWRAVV